MSPSLFGCVCVCALCVFLRACVHFFFVLCVCCVCVVRVVCVCVCVYVSCSFFVVSTLSLAPWSPGISYFLALLVCLFLHHILFLLQACTFDEDGAVTLFRCPSALVPAWPRTVLDVARETMTTFFIPSSGVHWDFLLVERPTLEKEDGESESRVRRRVGMWTQKDTEM